MEKRYRCGWCGQPTGADGESLMLSLDGSTDEDLALWDNAEKVNGECCPDGDGSEERQYVTREMAMDAGDLSLEGTEW